jgi:hypothetical protein
MPITRELPEVQLGPDESTDQNRPNPNVLFGHYAGMALANNTARHAGLGPSERDEAKVRDYHRPSDAGKCARALSYVALGVPRAPMDHAGGISTSLGSFVGEVLANALIDNRETLSEELGREVSEIRAEVSTSPVDPDSGERKFATVETADGELKLHGFIDIWIQFIDGGVWIIEVKTVGDYSFKSKTGLGRGPAEGPDRGHVLQLAEYVALYPEVEKGFIVYLANNPVSRNIAAKSGVDERRRVAAEWSFDRDELVPLAEKEFRRAKRILLLAAEGEKAPRRIPGLPGGEIISPATGAWKSTDGKVSSYWGCAYCGWQDVCAQEATEEATEVPEQAETTEEG